MELISPATLALLTIIVLVVIVLVVMPVVTSADRKTLYSLWQVIANELVKSQHSNDAEKRSWGFQTVTLKADSFLGKVLTAKGCRDDSVKQKLRTAMQKKFLAYEDFQVLKDFHVLRNQVAHEERMIQSYTEEQLIVNALTIIKKLLDTV